jgi:hypothetical protein
MARHILRGALALAALLAAAGPAAAQSPSVTFVFPPGGQTGTKAALTFNGGNLQGATGLLISGTGVQAAITKNDSAAAMPVELTIAPDAAPGLRELRVVTPRGVSNAARVWISGYPDASEAEPNNTLDKAQKLEKLPVVANGQVNGGEDRDYFSFQAAAGDTYVFDLVAAQMASGLDGFVSLLDSRGKVLISAQDSFDRDPRIIHTFKTAGTYLVEVRDSMYRGGGNFVYRLTMGKVPVITGYLPVSGRRGQTVEVSLEGVNLGAMASMPVKIPMEGDEVTVGLTTPMGPSANPISLFASDNDEVVESEPNNILTHATPADTLPISLNGRIDKPGDVDLYRIKPAAAGNLSFEVWARRIGSRLDSFLRILDATGKEVNSNDDAQGKDSRIVFGVAAGTEYVVEVRSQDRRAGGDMFYRLEIAPPGGQDFALSVTPDEVNVGQGGATAVTVNVQRINGFGGKIDLKVDGLPAGITASPAFVPAGQQAAQFTLNAEAMAAAGFGHIKVIGTATIAEKPVERTAQPVEIYRQPLAGDNQDSRRPCRIFTAAVMPPTAYSLDLEQKAITAKKGTNVQIKVKAIRQMGVTQQINLTVAGQPGNVNPQLQNVNANANEAVITLAIGANAPSVTQNIIITGNLNNNVQVAPAFTLTIE